MALTMESLLQAANLIKRGGGRPLYPTPFSGMRVVIDNYALADTTERNFSESKHRSKRVHKKLVKRFGGEFKKAPAMFRVGDMIVAHPVRYAELRQHFSVTN